MLRSLRNRMKRENEPRVLILGLDNAGKTTILNTLGEAEEKPTSAPEGPTQGFNIMDLNRNGQRAKLCDLGGQRALREYWQDYYANTDCIMYVVDSSDVRRLEEAHTAFVEVLDGVPNVPVLVFANKQDLAMAKDPQTVAEVLHLEEYRARPWHIQGCSAKTGAGLEDGVAWIFSACKTITCGLCFCALSKPLTFSCQHSFCSDCVRKQLVRKTENGFLCPLCAIVHLDVTTDTLDQYVDKQLETYIRSLAEGKYGWSQCQWCEEKSATLQCGECMSTYCEGCAEVAHKRPAKRHHVITKLNDSYRSFFRRCQQYGHEEYRAEFLCEDCGEVCCAYCLQVGPHKDHRSTNVTRAAAEARQQMSRDMQWLAQSKTRIEAQTTELNRMTAIYGDSYDRVEAMLTERFATFRQQLAQREIDVRRSLAQLRDSGDGALTAIRQQYLVQLNAVNEVLLRFHCLQSGGADHEVLESKALLDRCAHGELPTLGGSGFHLLAAGELTLSGPTIELDLQSANVLRGGSEDGITRANGDGAGSRPNRSGAGGGRPLANPPHRTAQADSHFSAGVSHALEQPLRLTFPVDEDVEATVRPDGVFLRCIARGAGGVQIGVRSKEMLDGIVAAHPKDGGIVSWQVRLENVSDTFLGIVEKTTRSVVPEGFYWKPACAGVTDGHLGRQTAVARRLPVCRGGDIVRFVYDAHARNLRVIVNEIKDCGIVVEDVHPKVAACFIFYPGESLTVLF